MEDMNGMTVIKIQRMTKMIERKKQMIKTRMIKTVDLGNIDIPKKIDIIPLTLLHAVKAVAGPMIQMTNMNTTAFINSRVNKQHGRHT